MFETPPIWKKLLTVELIEKIQNSKEVQDILSKAQKEYVYWDKFKYYNFPQNITPKEAWAFVKLSRMSLIERTPVKSISGDNFSYNIPKDLYQKLNFIDTHGAGLLKSFQDKPSSAQTSKYIISSLTEESIASSQIEGANTTHKIAKEMILSQRKPRNKSEQMIVNNYLAMQKIAQWKDIDLTEQMLLDLQKILIDQTVDEPLIVGRFRRDEDEIVVSDQITGEIAHVPPKEKLMLSELKRFIQYANQKESDDSFIHPVVKASILHFWFAYLHPFADGNGRSSRAIFYWYLLKNDYWLIEYVSISRAIKQSRKAYDNAFLYSENDDNDMTYFLLYITETFKKSILQFMEYFERKEIEIREIKSNTSVSSKFNIRQTVLLQYFSEHPDESIDVATHQNKNGISRPSAYNDLAMLVKKGLLAETRNDKRLIYMPNINKIKKLFNL